MATLSEWYERLDEKERRYEEELDKDMEKLCRVGQVIKHIKDIKLNCINWQKGALSDYNFNIKKDKHDVWIMIRLILETQLIPNRECIHNLCFISSDNKIYFGFNGINTSSRYNEVLCFLLDSSEEELLYNETKVRYFHFI